MPHWKSNFLLNGRIVLRYVVAFVVIVTSLGVPVFAQTTIYSTTFNDDNEGWTDIGVNPWIRAANMSAAMNVGADGNFWGFPNDGLDYSNNESALVRSPEIDLTGYVNMTFSIDIRYNTGNNSDGYHVEYSDDGGSNWFELGAVGEGTNWYTDNDIAAFGGVDVWENDNGEWETATIPLPCELNNNPNAQFRVFFGSSGFGTDDGVAFDNVVITGFTSTGPTGSDIPGDVSANLLFWLRADSGVVSDDNGVVLWEDWSGNSLDAFGCGPTGTTNVPNGNASITFDGADDFFNVGDVLNLQPTVDEWTVFTVFNTSSTGTLFSRASTGSGQYQYFVSGGNFDQVIGGTTSSGSSTVTGAWQVASSTISTSATNTTIGGGSDISGGSIGSTTQTTNVNIGAYNDGANDLFTGDIAEIIVFYSGLSAADIRDVESYLALKHSVSLDISSTGYTVNGTEIFDPADLTGYQNDVAGVGIDNSQGLNQAVGKNASGNIVRISDPSDLGDGEYLFWGHDGGAITTTPSNTPAEVSNRISRIWRFSETGDVGTVSISFDINTLGFEGRTFNLLTVPNIATIPGDFGTATVSSTGVVESINGRDYVTFTGVAISDQEYFTLGLTDAVTGPGDQAANLWLRADFGVTQSSNAVSEWTDLGSGGNDASQATAADQPTYQADAINGNPALEFDGGDDMDGSAGFYTHEFFIVTEPNVAVNGSANGFLVGFEPGEFGGFYVGDQTDGFVGPNERVVHAIGDSGDPDDYRAGIETGTLSAADQPIIWSVRENAIQDATEISLDGTALTVNSTFTGNAMINLSNQAYRLGDNLIDDNGYSGSLAEVISFSTRLTDANRRDVETYLAIKYGITLGDIATGYTVSNNTLYNNASYANDIAGIGRNDSQGLLQASSQSISGNAIRFANASDLDDGEYLIWGHDGGATTTQTGDRPAGAGVPNRITRVWTLAEHDGTSAVDVGTVDLTFDLSGLGIQSSGTYELYISSSATIASGTVTTSPTISGSLVTFSGISVTDGDFFSLGVSDPTNPGNVSGVTLWLDSEVGITLDGSNISSWADQSTTGANATQNTAGSQPEYIADQLNGHPGLYFDGADNLDGNDGFYTEEVFVVAIPSEIYNSGDASGNILGYNGGSTGRLALGPTSGVIANEVITHAIGNANYRRAFTSTTTNLNQPALINSRTNVGATSHEIYFNGLQVDDAETGTYFNAATHDYQVGEDDNGSDFDGSVFEVISYSSRIAADADRRDVETYLAIKYGITLDLVTSMEDYTVSGTSIYGSTGYPEDIAGIGRSDASNQNQTSSKSSNSGSIVRMESASDLGDGEYLVWGNDGGNNGFVGTSLPPGNSERLEKTWTVEETSGDVGTVAVSFDITSLAIDLDNSTINLFTLPSGSTIPTGFTGATVNSSGVISQVDGRDIVTFNSVDFSDGDFFTIGGDIQTASPGGSSALTLWLNGEAGVSSTGGLVSSWADQSGTGNDVTQGNSSNQPTLVSGAINYNDALDFDGDNLEAVNGFYTDEYFLVVKPDNSISNSVTNGYVLGFETNATTGFFVGDENFVGSDLFGQTLETAGFDASATSPTSISNSNVVIFNVRNNLDVSPTAQLMFANGDEYTVSPAGTFADLTDSPIRIGDTFDDDRSFNGLVAEVLVYSARLTTAQRRDVETYLAIKYGVTLDLTEDYTANGSTIFDLTGSSNDIAGLGKLLDYGLNQTQSVSQNTGAIVKMENASDLDDTEFIIWGNEGSSKTTPQTSEIPAEFDERLPAEWQVAVTGSPGTVTVKMYVGGIDNFSERPQSVGLYELLIDDMGTFDAITSSVTASSLANDTLIFENVSFSNGDYFTLALAPQPDVTGVTLWLRADVEIEEGSGNPAENNDLVEFWRDQSGNNNDLTQGTFARRPTYNENQLNGNPVITFDDDFTYLDLASTNLNPRTMYVVYQDVSTDFNTTPFTNDDNDDGTGIGAGDSDGTNVFDDTNTPADVSDNGANYANGTDILDGTSQPRPANYEIHSRVFNSNLSNANWNYYVGNDRGTSGRSIGGGVAEVLVYTTAQNDTDRRDVETYLALKYGITLDISSLNYTYNSGTSIYNLSSYSNDIAGIGSNGDYSLSQASSTSINSGAIVTMSSATSQNNDDFLVWGHDSGVTTEVGTNVPPGIGMRMTRIWGVNETNDIGTVTVTMDLGAGYSGKDVSELTLIVDNNADFSTGVLRTYTAQSFASNIVTFAGVDFTGASNFGLGTTINLSTDTDGDGIPDYFESAYGTNHIDGNDPVTNGGNDDDGDGLSNALESILVTNGATAPVTVVTDTDGDGISDHVEVEDGSDPFSANSPTTNGSLDTDNDGIPDGLEALIDNEGGPANPDLSTDTDLDGVPDYYEVLNGTNPNDVNDPFLDGGSDDDGNNDGDGISDALEQILEDGGAGAPLSATTDTDGDGIPDYVEAQTFTDPFNSATPFSGVTTVRSLQADYEATGGDCVTLSGYQWVDVTDLSGNVVFSINPFGNNLGSTCWGVRVLSGQASVRNSSSIYYLNRNWYIEPNTQPTTNVYVRLYALDQEVTDLTNRVNTDEMESFSTTDILNGMVILKVNGDTELDPLVNGGGSTDEDPTIVDFSVATADAFVLELSSFSTLDPHVDTNDNLPIELISFEASNEEDGVMLEWYTATELNNDFFTIERSFDGETFSSIAEIDGAGNSSETLSYEYLDRNVQEGIYFYRLKQTDFDGQFSYSETIAISHSGSNLATELAVYPNPVNGESFFVSTASLEHGINFEVSIHDLMGRQLKAQLMKRELNNVLSIDVSDIENGVYIIRVRSERGSQETRIIIDK